MTTVLDRLDLDFLEREVFRFEQLHGDVLGDEVLPEAWGTRCSWGCSGDCSGTCKWDCSGTCKWDCSGSCKGTCRGTSWSLF